MYRKVTKILFALTLLNICLIIVYYEKILSASRYVHILAGVPVGISSGVKDTKCLPRLFHLLNSNGIIPVVLEPALLKTIRSDPHSFEKEAFFSISYLGIMQDDVSKALKITEKTAASNTELISMKGTLPYSVYKNAKKQFVICFIFRHQSQKMYLPVMFKTRKIIFISKCDTNSDRVKVHLSQTDLVFNRMNFVVTTTDKIQFAWPQDFDKYILQFDSSRFIECRWDLGNVNQYPSESNLNATRIINSMVYLRDNLLLQDRLPFMAFGTLLGWYRQCHIIKDTGDADFGLFSKDLNSNLHENLQTNPNIYGYTINWPEDGFQYLLWVMDERIDLFFIYDTKDPAIVYTQQWAPEHEKWRVFLPRSDVCSGILLGERFNVPCKVEAAIEYTYGKEWAVYYGYESGTFPLHSKYIGKWSEHDWPLAIVDLNDSDFIPKMVKEFESKYKHTETVSVMV